MTINEFTNTLLPYALNECLKRGYSSAVAFTCLCQCALETGWLKSDIMREMRAPFGIKYTGNGNYYSANTTEYINGVKVNKEDRFRAYSSWEESFADYFDLLESGRYKACLSCKTVLECISTIKAGGYATDPAYTDKILGVYDTIVRNLRD